MAIKAYCPQCGHLIRKDNELDLKDYWRSQCRFCGFNKGFAPIPIEHRSESLIKQVVEHIKFTRKLRTEEYFGRKPTMWEEDYMSDIEGYDIDKNPLYNKDLAIKSAKLWGRERDAEIKAKDDARAEKAKKKLMDEAYQKINNQPHCPTCGSTNVKKLDVVDRAVSVGTLGIFSNKINKSFKCKNCGHTW